MYTILAHTSQIAYGLSVIKKDQLILKCPMLQDIIITHYYTQENYMLNLVQIVLFHKAAIFN